MNAKLRTAANTCWRYHAYTLLEHREMSDMREENRSRILYHVLESRKSASMPHAGTLWCGLPAEALALLPERDRKNPMFGPKLAVASAVAAADAGQPQGQKQTGTKRRHQCADGGEPPRQKARAFLEQLDLRTYLPPEEVGPPTRPLGSRAS